MTKLFDRIPLRGAAIGTLITVLLVALLIDKGADSPTPVVAEQRIGAAPAAAISSAFYCPLTYATRADPTAGGIFVVNPSDKALSGTATMVPQNGANVDVPVEVAPRSRVLINPGSSIDALYASVLVTLNGGGASVEQFIRTLQGDETTPCAYSTSQQWYFADGSTEAGAELRIGIFNPYDDNAVLDASFVADEGPTEPGELQGVTVAPHSMTVLNVSDSVRRRTWVATQINLRSGRVAAAMLQTGYLNGAAAGGYTVGQAAPSMTQYVPDVNVPSGRREGLALFNPNNAESQVEVSLYTDEAQVQPFRIFIPAHGRVQVPFDTEARTPKDRHFAAVTRVLNGLPVVAQRTVTAIAPSSVSGGSFMTTSESLARSWVIAANGTLPKADGWVYIFNPGSSPANVTLTLFADGNAAAQPRIQVGAGKRYAFHVNDVSADAIASVTVTSDTDIAVSHEATVAPGPNISVAPATPLRR